MKALRRSRFIVLSVLCLLLIAWAILLINASTHKTLDQRVQDVAGQLKCPVCQGESVADSPSTLAREMRGIIRQQLSAGKSEQEVVQYFANVYGDSIVWSPPWSGFTLLAWLVPIGLLLVGMFLLYVIFRAWQSAGSASALNAESTANEDDSELQPYRALLEEELAAEDVLFRQHKEEVG